MVCWNVHLHTFARDNAYVLKRLEAWGYPDIICLQEYVQGRDDETAKWFKKQGYDTAYLPFATYPKDHRISQGVLTATKKSLRASTEPVVLRSNGPRWFRNFPNVRGLLDATIAFEGKQLHVLNFHATYARPHTTDMRRDEFGKLQSYLAAFDEKTAWLIGGDFNFFGSDSRKAWLIERYAHFTGNGRQKTWRHKSKILPLGANLDYLFWSGETVAVVAKLMPFSVSDHRPIQAKISLLSAPIADT